MTLVLRRVLGSELPIWASEQSQSVQNRPVRVRGWFYRTISSSSVSRSDGDEVKNEDIRTAGTRSLAVYIAMTTRVIFFGL